VTNLIYSSRALFSSVFF